MTFSPPLQEGSTPAKGVVAFCTVNPLAADSWWSGLVDGRGGGSFSPAAQAGVTAKGRSLVVGAGGVGRAVAFGLRALGAADIAIMDQDGDKAARLARDVGGQAVKTADGPVDGLLNCTPIGMVGYDGLPVGRNVIARAAWVFDAVYTPPETAFLKAAAAAGVTCVSGVELFFWQGVHAARHFFGRDVEPEALRRALAL